MRMASMASALRKKRTGGRLVWSAGVLMVWGGMSWMAAAQTGGQAPVDVANPLVGTAPLDGQSLIGNAPPPGGAGLLGADLAWSAAATELRGGGAGE